ncbi:PREDICTED: biotin--protein ligase 2-like isoform X1 [Erythranthe guttata]|uniref:biotin--protein ligase 2-like isoform X1 n=1 Tax=Erythranthe guttata TaxID=4155 RepID=UPI00064DDA08|nr:PREDICTED: biotin--protein ligase 2-like isoform X1 [Erythranthe guttata]|eukprot:XP_012854994.1 PREDICTED: biotin--protein ligase 2-like isoform X1 [Erythranthe guttata]
MPCLTKTPRFLSLKCPHSNFSLFKKLNLIPNYRRLSAKMEAQSSTTLVLCGKSSEENEAARLLKINNVLKLPDTSPVTAVLHSEAENRERIDGGDSFRINSYMNFLSTYRFGKLLVYSPKLASTHDVVSTNFLDLPIGAVCVADVQFKGRGRSKNVWESPKGCLLFSFTLQMEDGRIVPLVQYVVCLAMTEAINDVCRRNGMPCLDVRIKWPNDLYLDGLKVGGILCTSTYKDKKFNVSAGIGLNVNNEKPTTCLNAILQRLGYVSHQLQREDIVAAFFSKFESFYDIFISQGFQALEELYYKTWLHSGQRVIIQEKSDNQDQVSENVVTIQGLTSSGYLLAATEDGETCELHPDGNRLLDGPRFSTFISIQWHFNSFSISLKGSSEEKWPKEASLISLTM